MAKRAATGFATLCFGKPRQHQEGQEIPPGSGEDVDTEPVPEARKREIATHDQANQTDDADPPSLETQPQPQPSPMNSSSVVAVRPLTMLPPSSTSPSPPTIPPPSSTSQCIIPPPSTTTPPITSLSTRRAPSTTTTPTASRAPSDHMLSKVRHAQWSWSWAVKSVKLNQRFVQALLAAHYEFPEMMDKRLLLNHIQSLGRVLRAYAMQQPEFVDLEETVQEDLLKRNTPIFVQVP